MQSCLWSKALCPAATGLHSRSSRLLVCQQIASRTARRRRIHGDGSNKAYPELEDILGKPATTFEQLIGQLETLIKHPNPPRNYADALAKNELRRVDRGDLTTDKSSGRHDSSRTMLLQQRPRMLRNMNSELDRGLSAEDAGMGAGQDELTDLSDIPEMSSNVPSTHEVSPLPEEVAINLGINSEQQERRRIWMTKIAGYRAFRSNLMSMNSLLNSLDERRRAEKSEFDANEQDNDDGLDRDRVLGSSLDSNALSDDDREFEQLIRKSWKLYDEDFVDPVEKSYSGSSGGGGGGGGVTPGKRSYHTSRIACGRPNSSNDLPAKARADSYSKKTAGEDKDRVATSQRGSSKERPSAIRRLVIRAPDVGFPATKKPRNLIRRAIRPSLKDLKRHFAEQDEYADQVYVPIDATVSTGDLIEMRQTGVADSATQYGVSIGLGGIVQRTTGRFHFNYVGPFRGVMGGREARLGFVAKGLLFDRKLLQRSGVANKDIERILEYGEELRSYEAEHGEHVLTSAQEALKLQRAFGQQSVGGLVDKDVEIGVNMASVGALADDSLADCMLAESQEGEAAESQENISDLLVRNFPRALRTFQQEAEQLMRSHIRELGDYWGMALHRGQTHVTVESLARLTFGKKSEDEPLDDVERLAAYMHMVSDPLHYIPDADGLFVTCRFELRPRSEVENIVRVRDLIRENAPEFTQFVGKARKLVAHAHAAMPLSPLRAALDPTVKSARASNSCKLTGWAPDLSFAKRKLPAEPVLTKDEVAKTEFTPEDSQFLLALRSYVFHANAGFQNLTNPYESLVSPILKKMHYYSGCDVTTVARFLVDVGVWPHWYNQKLNMRDQHHASFNRYRNTYLIERGAVASAALYYWGIPGSVDVDPAASTLAKPRLTEKQNVEKYKAEVKIAESIVPEVRCSVITQSSTGAGVIGKSALYGRDICEVIRHDFGNMPVYTIDDSTTRDVDDGLSLETIATLDGEEQEWIHVHIADPTALIHPGHLITHAAARQVATIYYTTDTRNMLPLGMVLDNISLVRRGDGSSPKEVYTMTISCRLGDDGDIAEYKIRPGIVRNIISSPYEVVDQHMSFERPLGGMDSLSRLQESKRMATYIHPFVPSDAELPLYGQKKTALSKEAIRTLRRIQELGRRHYDYRVRSGSFTRLLPSRDISINDGAKLTAPSFLMQRPTFLQAPYDSPEYSPLAYPKITSSYSSVILSPAHTMVGEMMVIAGRVAARFAYEHGPGTGGHAANSSGVIAGERGVPLLFRSQSMPNLDVLGGVAQGLPLGIEGLSASEAQSARAVWDAVIGQAKCNRGIISAKVFDEVRHMLNPSILSCTPGPHTIMGVTDKYGYTRITSPIRRLDDMIGHWQLKAQLLAMHTGSSDRQPWYWNHYDIERLAPIVFRRTQLIDSAARNDEEFWQLTLMRRMDSEARRGTLQLPPDGFYNPSSPLYFDTPWAYYNPGTPGPLTWTAMVDNRDETRPFISLVIVGLGTRAMLLPRPLDAALLPFAGTKVRVQIIGLDPAEAMLMVKLAPEEHQPVDTPKFWGSTRALNVIHSRFHLARTPPEDSY